jgi:hypothetical protein
MGVVFLIDGMPTACGSMPASAVSGSHRDAGMIGVSQATVVLCADPLAGLAARRLSVSLREFYALLWRAGVVEIVE